MNVMPLSIMKEMGLEVTRPYGNVCGNDSRIVQALWPNKTFEG